MPPTHPPTRQARLARYAVSAVFLVFGLLFGTWLPYIPDVKRNLGIDEAQLGQALLCSGIGAVITMQLVGRLIHRFGSRNVAFVTGLAACIGVPLLFVQTTFLGLCLNLFAVGLCYGGLDVSMNAHSVQVQALHRRSILASIHGCFSIGGLIGGFTASALSRISVTPLAHLIGTAAFLIGLLLFVRPYLLPSETDQDSDGPKFVLPRGILLVLGAICGAAFVAEGGILDWCALYVRDVLNADAQYAGLVTGFCSGAMALGRFFGDPVLHRLGNRMTIGVGGTICGVFVAAAVLVPVLWVSIACFAVACLGLANVVPAVFNEVGRVKDVPTGVGVAAVTTCGYGGFLLGPPIIGFVARETSLGLAMGLIAGLSVVMLLGARRVEPGTLEEA